jgi:hypothetical protein
MSHADDLPAAPALTVASLAKLTSDADVRLCGPFPRLRVVKTTKS